MVEPIPDNLPEGGLLARIARREFPHDARMADPLTAETVPHVEGLSAVDGGDFHAAVVDVAGEKIGVLGDVVQGRREARAADDQHSHPVDLVLNDGIGGNGGAEDDPLQLTEGGFIDQFGRDCEQG